MVFWKKNKKDKKEENVEVKETTNSEVKKGNPKKKKRNDGMKNFFDESVLESSLVELKENNRMVLDVDGDVFYIALLLETEHFGGFNKKSRKNESIGQIIEQIQSGAIKCILTPELMEKEELLLIPDRGSLDICVQFTQFKNSPYKITFVNDDMEFDISDEIVSLQDVIEFQNSNDSIYEFLSDHGFDFVEEEAENNEEEIDDENEEFIEEETYDSDGFLPEDEFVETETAFEDDNESSAYSVEEDEKEEEIKENEEVEEPEEIEENIQYDDEESKSYEETKEEDDEEEINEDLVEEKVHERLLSTELGLSITDDDFETAFKDNDSIVFFVEDRPDGWINNNLNELSRAFNTDRLIMHKNNYDALRKTFVDLTTISSKDIEKKFSFDNEEGEFYKSKKELEDTKNEALSNVDSLVQEEIDKLNKAFEDKKQKVGEDAKNEAMMKYQERYGRSHDSDLQDIKLRVTDEINIKYNNGFKELNDIRKDMANKEFEIAKSTIIEELSGQYADNLKQERDVYELHSKKIKDFINNNKLDEIARINALRKQNEIDNRVEINHKEYVEKLNAKSAEFKANTEKLRIENEEEIKKKDLYINEKIAKFNEEIENLRKANNALSDKNDKLYEDNKVMREDIKREYEGIYDGRIKQKENENKMLNARLDEIIEMQNKADKKVSYGRVATFVFAVLLSLSLGGIFSHFMTLKSVNNNNTTNISEDFNKRLDDIEKENEKKEKELQDALDKKTSENQIQQETIKKLLQDKNN